MPKVSVVVPTCRRHDRLARCLDALAAQDLDRSDFEVIVVDDAGEEATRRLVEGQGDFTWRRPAARSNRRRRGTWAGGMPPPR